MSLHSELQKLTPLLNPSLISRSRRPKKTTTLCSGTGKAPTISPSTQTITSGKTMLWLSWKTMILRGGYYPYFTIFPISPTSNLPFQTIAMDFIVKLPPSYGYDSILTITDHDVSKASIFIPCNESIDSSGVAELYTTHVFPHYGIPLQIISNRDP